jgi:hypothetical protein
MSYCSWCWSKGHNSASCPERKKHIKDNPDSYEAKREAKKLERRKARKQTPRKCGFCRKPGHNAKTCHTKKTIQEKYRGLCSAYRRKVLEEMCVMGLGVGSLVNLGLRGQKEPILAIVKDIKWHRIYPASDGSNYCIQLERLGPIDEEYYRHWSPERKRSLGSRHLTHLLSRRMMGNIYQRDDVYQRHIEAGGSELKVVSPVNVGAINPPADWLNGELTDYDNANPFKQEGKDKSLWDLDYEIPHFAYFADVLGMKETEKFFESFC